MEFRHIKTKRGPFGVTAFCPKCGKGFCVRYADGFRPGFHANQVVRKFVWDHMKTEET
jgi:hypothetical protein